MFSFVWRWFAFTNQALLWETSGFFQQRMSADVRFERHSGARSHPTTITNQKQWPSWPTAWPNHWGDWQTWDMRCHGFHMVPHGSTVPKTTGRPVHRCRANLLLHLVERRSEVEWHRSTCCDESWIPKPDWLSECMPCESTGCACGCLTKAPNHGHVLINVQKTMADVQKSTVTRLVHGVNGSTGNQPNH